MPLTKNPIFLYLPLFLLISLPQAGAQIMETKKPSFSSVLISDSRIEALKEAVKGKIEPIYSAFEACRIYADQNLTRTPTAPKKWHVPRYYGDAEGHKKAKNGLRDDANAAYAQALCFRITGEKKYAQSAVRLINAWATNIETMSREADSTLSFSYHFPALIFAADLIRDENVWPKDQQKTFSEFLRNKALPMSTINRANNWGNWGLVLSSSCAVYLKDEALFKKCVDRWKTLIEHQVAADGHLPHEVKRSSGQRGIWYTHFCLMPQTIAAEILKVNGTDLYDFKSPNGRTLKQAYEKIAEWTCRPDRFPYWKGDPKKLMSVHYFSYFEILNNHWPNKDASQLLSKSRPMTAKHSAPFLTFTHGKNPKENSPEEKAFKDASSGTWKKTFADSCSGEWEKNWFLDGEIGTVKTGPEGMTLTAGPEFRNDAHHMVLWTKDSFEGDLKIEYDYTRLDREKRCVTILYIQATGSGKAPYAKEITKWNRLRKVPAMATYFNNMNTYHISYAAFPNSGKDRTSYIRGRRYMPHKTGLKGTGLNPDYYPKGLFATGVKHHITVIKKDRDLFMRVENPDGVYYFHMTNPKLPVIKEGRIGLRHMFTRSATYKNIQISTPSKKATK